ncbi:MAG: hypothetical protein LBK29_03385 [Oscillospiraceae bacterium]|jgi:GTPase SAR1 family protein|nr:hypothetical protein [Oscillospiraceae bacterium]
MKNSLFKRLISSVMATFVLFPVLNTCVNADPITAKLILMGGSRVGKTEIFSSVADTRNDMHDRGFDDRVPFDFGIKIIKKDDIEVKIRIFDVSGQEELKQIFFKDFRTLMRRGDIVEIFAICTNFEKQKVEATINSFEECEQLRRDARCPVKIIFLINKSPTHPSGSSESYVSEEEVRCRLGELYENFKEFDVCCVDLSKEYGCNELMRIAYDLTLKFAEKAKKDEAPTVITAPNEFASESEFGEARIGSSNFNRIIIGGSLITTLLTIAYFRFSRKKQSTAKNIPPTMSEVK